MTRWQPAHFRRVGSLPLNRTFVDDSGRLTTLTARFEKLCFDQDWDLKWRSGTIANTTGTHSAAKLFFPSFTWGRYQGEWFLNLLYLCSVNGERFCSTVYTTAYYIDLVVARDVGCCRIWTRWRHTKSFMSRLVHLINLNIAKSLFWQSLHWELQC